jgi:hypothetical protein
MVDKEEKMLTGKDIIFYTFTSTVRLTSEEARLWEAGTRVYDQ